jgi:hypothetical protein
MPSDFHRGPYKDLAFTTMPSTMEATSLTVKDDWRQSVDYLGV